MSRIWHGVLSTYQCTRIFISFFFLNFISHEHTYSLSLFLSCILSLSLSLYVSLFYFIQIVNTHLKALNFTFFFSSTQCTYRWDCHLCSPADWNSWPVNTTINIKLFFYLKKKILFLFLLPLHDHDEIEFFFPLFYFVFIRFFSFMIFVLVSIVWFEQKKYPQTTKRNSSRKKREINQIKYI